MTTPTQTGEHACGQRETLQRTITNPGDGHMARGSIETMCLLCDDPSLSVPFSLSLTSLLSPHSDSLPFFLILHHSLDVFILSFCLIAIPTQIVLSLKWSFLTLICSCQLLLFSPSLLTCFSLIFNEEILIIHSHFWCHPLWHCTRTSSNLIQHKTAHLNI